MLVFRAPGFCTCFCAPVADQVDAGADFVVTQFFYDTEAYLGYVKRCRGVGIDCPIIPGIMAIQVCPRSHEQGVIPRYESKETSHGEVGVALSGLGDFGRLDFSC